MMRCLVALFVYSSWFFVLFRILLLLNIIISQRRCSRWHRTLAPRRSVPTKKRPVHRCCWSDPVSRIVMRASPIRCRKRGIAMIWAAAHSVHLVASMVPRLLWGCHNTRRIRWYSVIYSRIATTASPRVWCAGSVPGAPRRCPFPRPTAVVPSCCIRRTPTDPICAVAVPVGTARTATCAPIVSIHWIFACTRSIILCAR